MDNKSNSKVQEQINRLSRMTGQEFKIVDSPACILDENTDEYQSANRYEARVYSRLLKESKDDKKNSIFN